MRGIKQVRVHFSATQRAPSSNLGLPAWSDNPQRLRRAPFSKGEFASGKKIPGTKNNVSQPGIKKPFSGFSPRPS